MTVLPTGWLAARVEDIAKIESGVGFPKDRQGKRDGKYPFAKVSDISRAVSQANSDLQTANNYVDESDLASLRARPLPSGSVVFAKIGEALRLNRRALTSVELILDNNCMALVPNRAIEPRFLLTFMRTVDLSPFAVATAVPSVRRGDVASLALPLPPLAEQRRIVAKLDALTACTARARADLDRVPALAERQRRAIVTTSFSGFEGGFRRPFGELVTSAQNGLSKRRGDSGTPMNVLRLADLDDGRFVGSEPRTIVLTDKEAGKYELTPGDLVCIRVNGSERLVGRLLTWEDQNGWAFCDHFIRFKVDEDLVDPRFVGLFFSSEEVRAAIEVAFVSSAGQKTVSQSTLNRISVPVPTLAKQRAVVERIDRAFTEIDRLVAEAAAARRLLDRLDQAILAKAFRGELVTQDPADEPASVLLERIRAERATAPAKAKRGRKAIPA